MKKIYTLKINVCIAFILIIYNSSVQAQVGVGVVTPAATLDVTAANPTGGATTVDGILIPRVDRQRALAMTAIPVSNLVYVNSIATGTATGQAINITAVGFYTYDGTVWQRIGTGATDWSVTGNTGTNPVTNFVGTTDAIDLSLRTNSTEKVRVTSGGNVGIGTLPTNSTVLDMTSVTNKGVSFPNVNLLSETDAATILTPVAGLMVYNTNTTMPCGVGLYFNNGTPAVPSWACFTKTIKQYHAYNTARRVGITSATLTLQPGCTINFTVQTGQVADVNIEAVLGGTNNFTTSSGYSTFDTVVYVDGAPLARGGWSRTTITNSNAGTNAFNVNTLSAYAAGLLAGAHTIQLYTARFSGSSLSGVNLGGDCLLDTNCGEINATVSYK